MNEGIIEMEPTSATFQIDTSEFGDEKWEKLFKAERLLSEIGVTFDTGAGCGCRDWELDWSLKGARLMAHVRPEIEDHAAALADDS